MSAAVASPLNDLPGPYEVGNMFRLLLGRTVTARTRPGAPSSVTRTHQVAVYVDDRDQIMAVCLCSLALAAACGAALSMLSAELVDEARAMAKLSQTMEENHYEVMNISARFFNSPYSPHIRLQAVYQVDQGLPKPVRRALGGLGSWMQLDVDIEDYGGGTLFIAHVGQGAAAQGKGTQPNQRAHTRATIAAEVVLASADGEMVMGMGRDLSIRGAYITCDQVLDMGARCTLLLFAPMPGGDRKVKLGAQVVRLDATGLAVRFTVISDEADAVLADLVMRKAADPDKVMAELEKQRSS